MSRIIPFVLLLVLISNSVPAYELHEPILVENVHATADDPYIIEGYEVSSDRANCIEVRNSQNVIIRNNHLHHCNWSKAEGYDKSKGFAVLIDDSENILIENNLLEDNKQGITVLNSEDVDIFYNNITRTVLCNSLTCERCDGGEIKGNRLFDNGVPEWFWAPGYRIMAVNLIRSSDFEIHDNIIVRSSSDGMLIIGMIYAGSLTSDEGDWTGITDNIRIYNNVVLDNMEIGIVAARARNIEVFNNTVRAGCFTPTGVIVFDVDVRDSKIYNNKLLPCSTPGPLAIGMSKNNDIYDNVFYSIEQESVLEDIDFINYDIDDSGNRIKAEWSGIDYYESHDNRVSNNTRKTITGKLAEELQEKLRIAEREDTFTQKGWFYCEVEEGKVDKDCVERERQKGNQGVPREYLPYSSLMYNFEVFSAGDDNHEDKSHRFDDYEITDDEAGTKDYDSEIKQGDNKIEEMMYDRDVADDTDYAYDNEDKKTKFHDQDNKKEDIQTKASCEECDHTMEKVYSYLFFLALGLLILVLVLYLRKRK
jgi:parallel beta-helix repeat protein